MHIIVVGAGISGLSIGMILAAYDFDVTILEKNNSVGGKCSLLQDEQQIYNFDIGPDMLINPFVLEDLFWQCNLNFHNYIDMKLLDPQYQLIFSDGSVLKPSQNLTKYKESIKTINPKDTDGIDKFMLDNSNKFENLYTLMRSGVFSNSKILDLNTIKNFFKLNPKSLWKHLDKYFQDHRIKAGFSLLGRYVGVTPQQSPSIYSLLTFLELNSGLYYINGGLHQIAAKMKDAFVNLGGKIHFQTEVKHIKFQNNQATGVELTSGDSFDSDHVILGSDIKYNLQDLLKKTDKKIPNKLKKEHLKYSHSYLVFYYGLDIKYSNLMHHSICLPQNYLECYNEIHKGKIPDNLMYRIHNPSVTDESLTLEGNSIIKIVIPIPNLNSDINWNEMLIKQIENKVLKDLSKKFNMTNLFKHIKFRRVFTPVEWETIFNNKYGASHSLLANYRQTMLAKPNNNLFDINNLWIAGESTQTGSNINQVCESAKITTYNLLKSEGVEIPEILVPPISI